MRIFRLGKNLSLALALCLGACSQPVSFSTRSQSLDVSDCPAGYNIIVGTDDNDIIYGTEGNDCIYDPAGNDIIYGLGGDDFIIAGDGNDVVYGGDGDDTIYGEAGNDRIYGQAGNDTLIGGDGNDHVWGGDGDDSLAGDAGNDELDGGDGDDVMAGGEGNDRFDGGAGDDTCIDSEGSNNYGDCETVDPLAVFLLQAQAQSGPGGVTVRWATGSERNNAGFHVYRLDTGGRQVRLTEKPVPGLVNAALGRAYSFVDPSGGQGDRYLIEDIETSGRRNRHDPVEVELAPASEIVPMRTAGNDAIAKASTTDDRNMASSQKVLTGEAKVAVRTAGLVGLRPGMMVERRGEPVPVLSSPAGTWFVGVPERDRYADYEVVTARPGAGLPMDTRRVSGLCDNPQTEVEHELTIEENHVYYVASPSADPFYWAQAFAGAPAELTFDVPGLRQRPAEIRIELCATAELDEMDHEATVRLNGKQLGAVSWEGRGISELRFAIEAGLLTEQGNVVTIGTSSEIDVLFADRIVVNYTRRLHAVNGALPFDLPESQCVRVTGLDHPGVVLLDVSNPARPVELTGFRVTGGNLTFRDEAPGRRSYLVALPDEAALPEMQGPFQPGVFTDSNRKIDYLIVTHPDFLEAAGRMQGFHRSRGLTTAIATTDRVYDSFSHGRPAPGAILEVVRRFEPDYLLLLGGATVDSNDVLGAGNRDFVPAPFVVTSLHGWEAAADGWYAEGRDMAIGRLAVSSPEEAQAVVDKIVSQAENQPLDRMTVVADRDDLVTERFEDMADTLLQACLPDSLHADRLSVTTSPDAASELRALAEAGTDLIAFFGHAFVTGWSSPPIVTADSAGDFTNERKFLLLSFSCFDGGFAGPWGEALAWSFVRNPQGGALAAVASSSLSDPWAVRMLSEQILCLLTGRRAATIGAALSAARRSLPGLHPALDDAISTFNLLGDPATPNPWVR